VPEWRNGRRSGLKLRGPQGRPSSNLGSGTIDVSSWRESETLTPGLASGLDEPRDVGRMIADLARMAVATADEAEPGGPVLAWIKGLTTIVT
jgi:hypothetical protein